MKTCTSCGISKADTEYYANKGRCKECISLAAKAKYLANPDDKKRRARARYYEKRETVLQAVKGYAALNAEKVREYQKAWGIANKDRKSMVDRAWRLKNKDKKADYGRVYGPKWRDQNRALYNARAAKRRAEKVTATPPWADKFAIECVYKLAAAYRTCGLDVHVDHIIPLKGEDVSGLHVETNLCILYASENISKSNKLIPELLYEY